MLISYTASFTTYVIPVHCCDVAVILAPCNDDVISCILFPADADWCNVFSGIRCSTCKIGPTENVGFAVDEFELTGNEAVDAGFETVMAVLVASRISSMTGCVSAMTRWRTSRIFS